MLSKAKPREIWKLGLFKRGFHEALSGSKFGKTCSLILTASFFLESSGLDFQKEEPEVQNSAARLHVSPALCGNVHVRVCVCVCVHAGMCVHKNICL